MAMTTGAKVAIGCGIVAVLGMLVVAVTIGVGAFWLKGKAEEMTGGLEGMARKAEEIEAWEKKANAHGFTAPADGVIAEDRLLKFLEVREQMYGIYEQHRGEIERLAARTEGQTDLSVSETLEGAGKLASLVTDLRLTQMKGLAGVGMNEEEYRFLQMAVYRSAWASEAESETGELPAETLREQSQTMPAETREALERLRESGAAGGAVSEEQMGQLADQLSQMMEGAATAVEVPRSNVELFRKHETEIRKYAMTGLAFLGL